MNILSKWWKNFCNEEKAQKASSSKDKKNMKMNQVFSLSSGVACVTINGKTYKGKSVAITESGIVFVDGIEQKKNDFYDESVNFKVEFNKDSFQISGKMIIIKN